LVLPLFEELSQLHRNEFEDLWDIAATSPKNYTPDLFVKPKPSMNATENPLLSMAAFDDFNIDEGNSLVFEDQLDAIGIDMPNESEDNDTVVPSPTKVIIKANPEVIKEIHSYSAQLEKPDEESKPLMKAKKASKLRQIASGRITKRQRKPNKKFQMSSDEEDDDSDYDEASSSNGSKRSKRKPKLYEVKKPFEDPELEQKRQNAINAKINRDRKKNEKKALMTSMKTLQQENSTLRKQNAKYRKRVSSIEARLAAMESILRANGLKNAATDPEE
jgi:hypothetical protein